MFVQFAIFLFVLQRKRFTRAWIKEYFEEEVIIADKIHGSTQFF